MLERLRTNFKAPVATAAAVIFGGVMLITYVFPERLDGVRELLLAWVAVASAAALLVGVVNLIVVHLGKVRAREGSWLNSLVLVLSLLLAFFFTLSDRPGGIDPQWLIEYIQIPVESSLMAVLAVTLTYAGAQLLSRRANVYSVLFWISALVTLAGITPLLGTSFPILKVAASAGGRGILIGVGLGTVATGLRILMGSDRPYGG